MATARSNKVSALLSFQDLAQLNRDYGKEVGDVIFNICGNIISGSVKGSTAKALEAMFGKIKQKKQSIQVSKESTSTTYSEQKDYLIPQDKITKLSQGKFVGLLADNFDQILEQKVFNSTIHVDKTSLTNHKMPKIRTFPEGKKDKILTDNFNQIIIDIDNLIKKEQETI